MMNYELTADEQKLAIAVSEGIPIDFPVIAGERVVINAEAVRRILLGQPVRMGPHGRDEPVAIYGPGLQMSGAKVKGKLDLAHACAADGSPVSLVLKNCIIADEIDLRNASLRHLSLRDSRITRLQAVGLRVAGEVDLCGLASAEKDGEGTGPNGVGCCWVELNGAEIGGSVNATSARLAVKSRPKPFDLPAWYALHLGGATIGNDLNLRRHPGSVTFSALGGLSVDGARIGSGLLADGAEFVVGEQLAINAQNARIEGSCLLRAEAPPKGGLQPFKVKGDVRLAGAKIGGGLEMSGAEVDGELTLETIEVRRTAQFNPARDKGADRRLPSSITDVLATGARFLGGLQMYAITIKKRLQADDIEVGGSVYLCAGRYDGVSGPKSFAAGKVVLNGASIAGNLDLSGAELKGDVEAWNIRVGLDLRLCQGPVEEVDPKDKGRPTRALQGEGIIDLSRAKVAGNFDVTGAMMRRELIARNVEVGGDVELVDCAFLSMPQQDAAAEAEMRRRVRAELAAKAKPDIEAEEKAMAEARREADMKMSVSLDGAVLAKSLKVALKQESGGWPRKVSLIDSSVEVLEDQGGKGWGKACALRLRGFRYARLGNDGGVRLGFWRRTLDGIGTIGGVLWLLGLCGLLTVLAALLYMAPKWFGIWPPLWLLAVLLVLWTFTGIRFKDTPALDRLAWLELQYQGHDPTPLEYFPDPYEQLTKAFREEGDYDSARYVTTERLDIERRQSGPVPRVLLLLYAWGFGYGLSPLRALSTFTACLLLGGIAAWAADHGLDGTPLEWLHVKPVLVVDANAVAIVAMTKPESAAQAVTDKAAPGAAEKVAASAPKSPAQKADDPPRYGTPALLEATTDTPPHEFLCGDLVEPALYALDAFVPALELHQHEKCSISAQPGARMWRLAEASYSILGWIVTSLMVLTVSGILGRRAEG
jgi:hypothetical protein